MLALPAEPAGGASVDRPVHDAGVTHVQHNRLLRREPLRLAPLKDALERAGSTDREKVRDAIAKTNLTDHILTQDAIRFDDSGENVNATPALLQVQGGKPVVVGPARFQEAKPVFPVPKWKS